MACTSGFAYRSRVTDTALSTAVPEHEPAAASWVANADVLGVTIEAALLGTYPPQEAQVK
jgi:hypothetical protein